MKKTKSRQSKSEWQFIMIGIILIIIAVAAIVGFLLQGQTTVSGNFPENKTSKTLSCEIDNLPYPIFDSNSSISSHTKINAIFDDDRISSISLTNSMIYSSIERAKVESENHHGNMNISFGPLGADALSARYTTDDVEAQMSLYANANDLNASTYRYFLINGNPTSSSDYMQNYTTQGFNCTENN